MILTNKKSFQGSASSFQKCNIAFNISKRFIGENAFVLAVEAVAAKAIKLETCSLETANEIIKGTEQSVKNSGISFHFRTRFNGIFSLRFINGNLDQLYWQKNLLNLKPNHHIQLSAESPALFDLLTKKIISCEKNCSWINSSEQLKVRGLVPLTTKEFINDFLLAQENFIKRHNLNHQLLLQNHLSVYLPDIPKSRNFSDAETLKFELYSSSIPTSIIVENLHLNGSERAINNSDLTIPTQQKLYAIENAPDFLNSLGAQLIYPNSSFNNSGIVQNFPELCKIIQTQMLTLLNLENIQLVETGLQTTEISNLESEATAMMEQFRKYPQIYIPNSWQMSDDSTKIIVSAFSFLTAADKKKFRKDMVRMMRIARVCWFTRLFIPMFRRFTKKHFF